MALPRNDVKPFSISVGVQTHVGRERTENQDRVSRVASPYGDLFLLADGVGGYEGGAEAAQVVVDGYTSYLNAHGDLDLEQVLQQATQAISAELAERQAARNSSHGMGSTVVLCVVQGNRVTYAHAGDSRIYLVRNRQLSQLTRDHSVMERMIAHGILTSEQASDHPDASALTRALGLSSSVTLDIGQIEIQSGDSLLLCSDGLWAYATHPEMEAVATSEGLSASSIAEALLNLALDGGGGDNISIQFLHFMTAEPSPATRSSGAARQTLILAALTSALLGATTIGASLWNGKHPLTKQDRMLVSQSDLTMASAMSGLPDRSSGTQTSPPPAPSARTPLTIVSGVDYAVPLWAYRLDDLTYLEASVESGTEDCLALSRSSPILFHSGSKRRVAIRVQQDLLSDHVEIAEMSREDRELCGGSELLVLPARTTHSKHSTADADY